ncbi:GAF domain-containing protein [Sporichthya brevicatena]|uniref:GAF domain-containing protein n=1 Tax=Sporichthya brevicatena TaxID=171442 RepID=A0ABN1GQ59_9ACTN
MKAPNGFNSIRPGTDLPTYARALQQAHEAITSTGRATALRPRPVIARSWNRSQVSGLRPLGDIRQDLLTPSQIDERRESSLLAEVIEGLRRTVTSYAEASHYLLAVTDDQGMILWREGSTQLRHVADRHGFVQGALFTEDRVGTNAIGTALAEECGVQVFSAEHYCVELHPWYCTAAPVHDPRTGRLAGIVDVSGPALTLHPAIGALVETAVHCAEMQIWQRHVTHLERLRSQAASIIATLDGPALIVDDEGWIAEATGIATGRRVAVPCADRAISVPGLGVCVPERINGGWLLRPAERQERINLTLDLHSAPVVSTCSDKGSWRFALTARHAELLLLVHLAGRAGIGAAALSEALYGDAEHVVAVRAEVSRLRRSLGAIVLSRPYRLADEVDLVIDWGDAELAGQSPVVAGSMAPAVRALADRPVSRLS